MSGVNFTFKTILCGFPVIVGINCIRPAMIQLHFLISGTMAIIYRVIAVLTRKLIERRDIIG